MKLRKIRMWLITLIPLVIIGIFCALLFGLVLNSHTHTFEDNWTYDETNHWHAATCSHKDQIVSLAPHIWSDEELVPQTETALAYKKQTCTVCQFEKVETIARHAHDASNPLESDGTSHWRTCQLCGLKYDLTTHNSVENYSVTKNNGAYSVASHSTCTYCAHETTPVALPQTKYEVIQDTSIESGAKTFSTANTIYILDGTFSRVKFTIDAENVTIIGSCATTSIEVNYTENAQNSVIYECNLPFYNLGTNIYGDVSYLECTINSIYLTAKNKNINIVFDNCTITGTDSYGIHVLYGYDENSNDCNLSVTNCSFSQIGAYTIFLFGNSSTAKFGNIEIANNQFLGGWGDGKVKRAVLKLHQDAELCPISYDDITDTSKLTNAARALVTKILNSNNTFDKGGIACSYFNIDGIYFDTLD